MLRLLQAIPAVWTIKSCCVDSPSAPKCCDELMLRVLAAIEHLEGDRVPMDLGGTIMSGIKISKGGQFIVRSAASGLHVLESLTR